MKDLVILCGIPGSGKTTWAKQQKRTKIISRDDIRFEMLKDDEEYFSHENDVFAEFIAQIRGAIYSRDISYDTVIADATHLNYKSRTKLLNNIFNDSTINETNLSDYPIHFIYFNTPINICLERNAKRSGRQRVPDYVITDMYKHFTKPPLETIVVNTVRSDYIWEKSI